jgi:hypothetical protein
MVIYYQFFVYISSIMDFKRYYMAYRNFMKDKYLAVQKFLYTFFNNLRRNITDTQEVKVVKNNSVHNTLLRYYLLRVLYYLNCVIKRLKDKLDVKADIIKIVKDTKDGSKTMVLQNESLSNIFEYVERKGVQKVPDTTIFLKFEIINNSHHNHQPLCLKDKLMEYRDVNEDHSNILINIIKLSNIKVSDNAVISIVKFDNKKNKKEYTLNYKDVCDKHINYFSKLE